MSEGMIRALTQRLLGAHTPARSGRLGAPIYTIASTPQASALCFYSLLVPTPPLQTSDIARKPNISAMHCRSVSVLLPQPQVGLSQLHHTKPSSWKGSSEPTPNSRAEVGVEARALCSTHHILKGRQKERENTIAMATTCRPKQRPIIRCK